MRAQSACHSPGRTWSATAFYDLPQVIFETQAVITGCIMLRIPKKFGISFHSHRIDIFCTTKYIDPVSLNERVTLVVQLSHLRSLYCLHCALCMFSERPSTPV